LQIKKHARNVRALRHVAMIFLRTNSMRPAFDIANLLALRPFGHGQAACALATYRRCKEDALTID